MKRLTVIIAAALFLLAPLSASGVEMIAAQGVKDVKGYSAVSPGTSDKGPVLQEESQDADKTDDILYRIGT